MTGRERVLSALSHRETDRVPIDIGGSWVKRDFGDRLTFWGGIDTMRVLNFGTAADIRDEVKHKLKAFAPGGGYILNPTHIVQPDVPVENLLEMINAALAYGWFPIEVGH